MILADAAATAAAGRALSPMLRAGDVVALSGPLGAGKTSFTRGVIAGLGLAGDVPSPTFPILLPYDPPAVRLPVVHADLYRLNEANEADELGLDDLLEDAALLIEWPERLGARLWSHALRLTLSPEPAGGRCLTWVAPPAWEARWPPPGYDLPQ